MSTHNICFYGEIWKIILKLSPDTLLICFTGLFAVIQNIPSLYYDFQIVMEDLKMIELYGRNLECMLLKHK